MHHSYRSDLLAFDDASDARALSRLEEKLLDTQWLSGWTDSLREVYAGALTPQQLALLPPSVVQAREAALAPGSPLDLNETPDRFISTIELISGAGVGFAALVAQGRLARRLLLDLLLHPAAVVDLHLALYTSDSFYWIGRVKAALRSESERARRSDPGAKR